MALGSRKRPPPASRIQEDSIPAPVGGMNTVDAGRMMPPTDCIYAYNLIASALGVVSRTGWQERVTGLTGGSDNTVRTVIPFHASTPGSNRLFAATSSGIWDCTSSTASPSKVLSFATTSGNAGWGVPQAVVTAGGHFLLYADEVNGLHYYSETTGVWAAYATGSGAGEVSGVDPATIVSVTVWKNRVWLTQRGTASAWYLAAGAIFGAATEFSFGQRFAHGGYLVGLFNWSTDGGSGLDTLLVAIGAGGDVVIYVGTDPASVNTFGLKGVWFVGSIPAGRRIATDFGGDLLIISSLGLLPLSKLIIGNPTVDRTQYATNKISNLFSKLVTAKREFLGWSLHTHPTDNALVVLVPTGANTATEQLAMSTSSRGWTRYRDLPMFSAAVWDGALYFGTADGRLCINSGDVDGVLLADHGSSATEVQWSVLTPFRGGARNRQVQMVRPVLLAGESAPLYEATAKYDWDQDEPDEPTGTSVGMAGEWDYGMVTGTLGGDFFQPASSLDVTVTSAAEYPAMGGTVVVGGTEYLPYDSWDGASLALTDPTNLDHFAGESVRLVSAPTDDAGTWGVAVWGGADLASVSPVGAEGMGRDVAIAVRGSARSKTTLVAIDVLFTEGGFL